MKTTLRIKLAKCGIFTTSLRKDIIIRVFLRLYIPHGKVRLSRTNLSEFVPLLVELSAQNVPEARMVEARSTVFWMKNATSSAARGWYRLRGRPLRGARTSVVFVRDWSHIPVRSIQRQKRHGTWFPKRALKFSHFARNHSESCFIKMCYIQVVIIRIK